MLKMYLTPKTVIAIGNALQLEKVRIEQMIRDLMAGDSELSTPRLKKKIEFWECELEDVKKAYAEFSSQL